MKKLDLLVKALAHSINENKKKFNLLIIGEGPELSALKEIAQKEKSTILYILLAHYMGKKSSDIL